MPNAFSLLIWCIRILSIVFVITVIGYLFRRSWRKQGLQLTILSLFLVDVMTIFWAFEIEEKIPRFLFDGVTLTLAAVAIIFASVQFRDTRIQQREMRTIAGQMATRFAGFFPNNLTEIIQVVSKAQKSLDVMSDYVGYGHYSAPRQFDSYFRMLSDLPAQNIDVKVLVYARDMAQQVHENQFISEALKDLEQWEKLKQFCSRYENNLDGPLWHKIRACDQKIATWNQKTKHGSPPNDQQTTELNSELASLRIDFDRLMFDRQLMYLKELLERGIKIKQTREKLPFFMWCEDRHEAVFAFLHETSKAEREVSFITRDSRFVADSFEKKFDYLWEKAEWIKLIDVSGHLEPDWLPSREQTTDTNVFQNGVSARTPSLEHAG